MTHGDAGLRAEAGRDETSRERLAELAAHPRRGVREAVAARLSLPLELAVTLLGDPAWQVRYALIPAAAGDPDRQRMVARSDDKWVRAILAAMPNIALDVQRVLAADDFSETVERIAGGTRDRELFDELLRHRRPRVRAMCARNEALCTAEDAETLARDRAWQVRAAAAHWPGIEEQTLVRLAQDPSAVVQWNVLMRRGEVPRMVLDLIAEHGDDINALHARLRLDGYPAVPPTVSP